MSDEEKDKRIKELEKELQKSKLEKKHLEIEREEDKKKLLKLETQREEDEKKLLKLGKQRLEEAERYQIKRLIDLLKQYRITLRDYNDYTEKVKREFNDALETVTANNERSRKWQLYSSMGNIATSTVGVLGTLTGPVGFTVMAAPSVIGYLRTLDSELSSETVTEKANSISSYDELHMSTISKREDKILDLLRNPVSEPLKSDVFKIIDNTKILRSRIQTKLEYHRGMEEELRVGFHLFKSFILHFDTITPTCKGLTEMTINTVTGVKSKASVTAASLKSETMTTNATKCLRNVQKLTYSVGVVLDVKNIYDNTGNYKTPEIEKKMKVKIDECNKTHAILRDLMLEIDDVITQLTDLYHGA